MKQNLHSRDWRENTIKHQKSIEDLRQINSCKDKTIASLSTVNDELLSEIKRLKAITPVTPRNQDWRQVPTWRMGK